ncbi:N-myristoyl transferase [Tothia fuscella]|uniref:Glycylpeptide N-tetradecanoyltransferase n=1 Tax=Tothia fuscella TaxID=1048955 RepID=A0A9P4P522_9PEZI|nr:N-myristoyl transferase [Tothia fuscella]
MSSESKQVDPPSGEKDTKSKVEEEPENTAENQEEAGEDEEAPTGDQVTTGKKKKKSKASKLKNALTGGSSSSISKTSGSVTAEQFQQLLDNNPALKAEVGHMDPANVKEMMKNLDLNTILTGATVDGKNKKDMASYKFWQTQPVPSFDEARSKNIADGPIKDIDINRVSKDPPPMYEGFEWVTMDLDDEKQLQEVYDLLSDHYVEDNEAMFRFNYSFSFLNWALKAPGWKKEWHVGVRAIKSQKLVAFISGIPMSLRVRKANIASSEVNFLCIHKKLRDKRLAPVLIKEITRRCYLVGTFQAIYTGGSLLPTPVSTCRYFHRSLDWEKLYELKFSPLPHGSTPQRQIRKFALPDRTATPGLRPMKIEDVDSVLSLLNRYLARFDMAQEFSAEEIKHWLLHDKTICPEQVVWAYVVEDPSTKKISDFFSFYRLASTAIGNPKHKFVNAAYLYYYATETAFEDDKAKLKPRLNYLMKDALILAKKAKFDVFNALTLLDNPLFLTEQMFGAGDGQLYYYLYNYRAAIIPGGIDEQSKVSEKAMGGVGVVML